MEETHAVGPRLGPGYGDGRAGRVHTDNLIPTLSEHQSEHSCPAADVQDPLRTELVRDRNVRVEVGPVGIQRIVEPREPRIVEDGVRHVDSLSTGLSLANHPDNQRPRTIPHRAVNEGGFLFGPSRAREVVDDRDHD
ncbi:hypothetical protein GCM10025760_33150 [Microbacterium yannicii]|uniref:Uncharacterized protein n=1 Tax=Microbacterium yannicii TaxID=671622 RepID=A0ABP9MKV2_9MICO